MSCSEITAAGSKRMVLALTRVPAVEDLPGEEAPGAGITQVAGVELHRQHQPHTPDGLDDVGVLGRQLLQPGLEDGALVPALAGDVVLQHILDGGQGGLSSTQGCLPKVGEPAAGVVNELLDPHLGLADDAGDGRMPPPKALP